MDDSGRVPAHALLVNDIASNTDPRHKLSPQIRRTREEACVAISRLLSDADDLPVTFFDDYVRGVTPQPSSPASSRRSSHQTAGPLDRAAWSGWLPIPQLEDGPARGVSGTLLAATASQPSLP